MDYLLVMKTVANILGAGIRGRYIFLLFKVNLVAYIDLTNASYYKIIQQTCRKH